MSLADAWEQHAQEWIAWARTAGDDGFWDGTWPALQSVLPRPDGPTVEVGCGEGRVSRHLAALGHEVVAVERSPTLARAAAQGQPAVAVALGDAVALPVRGGTAAVVVACMVLQDLDDLTGSVREMARVLRSRGQLCGAIVHPFSSAQDPDRFRVAGPFIVDRPYLKERRYVDRAESEGVSMTFESAHRPLSVYAAALAQAGMVVEVIIEHGPKVVPWLLVFRARKDGGQ